MALTTIFVRFVVGRFAMGEQPVARSPTQYTPGRLLMPSRLALRRCGGGQGNNICVVSPNISHIQLADSIVSSHKKGWLKQDRILARLSKDDLAFYDGIAERMRDLLQDSDPGMSVATLAGSIGWSRSSLSNFLSRKNQTIPTHSLVRAARAFNVPASYLMTGDYI